MRNFDRHKERSACALGIVCLVIAGLPSAAYGVEGSQTTESGWYEIRDIRPGAHAHYYRWDLKADVTVTGGMVSGLKLIARTDYGDEVVQKNRKYFEPVKLIYEADVPDLGICARDYTASVDGIDAVSRATSTSHWARQAIKDALAQWNVEYPAAETFTVNRATVNAAALKAAAESADATASSATSITVGAKAKKISSGAFKAFFKVKTLTIKSTKLTKKSVKNSLKGSKVTTVKVPKSKKAAYKKIFTKANAGKKVTVK